MAEELEKKIREFGQLRYEICSLIDKLKNELWDMHRYMYYEAYIRDIRYDLFSKVYNDAKRNEDDYVMFLKYYKTAKELYDLWVKPAN